MANKKITELNEATSVSNNDWLVIVDVANDETKKVHASEVGGNIPIQDTAPQNPEEDDLWIDTSEPEEMQEAIVNEYSESINETYSCDYTNRLFIPREIENGGNDWKKVDLGFCKIYFINKSNTDSKTYSQNSWGYAFGISYPTNFTYDTTKSIFVGNAKCNDNAVVFNMMAGTNGVNVNYTNHYNSSITAAASYCCLLIDFS